MDFKAFFHIIWPYALQLGGIAFATFIGKHVITQTDSQRAQAIAVIAKDVATAVYANNPTLPWVDLVRQVVESLADATTLTSNRLVLNRAAISALTELGVKPK